MVVTCDHYLVNHINHSSNSIEHLEFSQKLHNQGINTAYFLQLYGFLAIYKINSEFRIPCQGFYYSMHYNLKLFYIIQYNIIRFTIVPYHYISLNIFWNFLREVTKLWILFFFGFISLVVINYILQVLKIRIRNFNFNSSNNISSI
jgi:hypothetical protein